MQRNTAIAVGLLVALCVVLVVVLGKGRRIPEHAAASASGSAPSSASAPARPSASAVPSALPTDAAEASASSEAFDVLPDGRKSPELPAGSPKQVGFGVVIVSYQGAQGAAKEAPPKTEAKRRALALMEEAARDFAAAVKKGDRGSTADAGHVPRDVLEPAIEYALFSIKAGEIYPGPVDTPRGFWIVRRNK